MLADIAGDADVTGLMRDRAGLRVTGACEVALPVFSVTKMFIAVTAVRLAESGQIGLDDELRRWLPAVHPITSPRVTVREVLSHTAGLPDYAGEASYREAVSAGPGRPWGLAEILAASAAAPRSPRGTFRYSNTGYWLLGAALENAAGTGLAELLGTTVFRRAGMVSTRYPEPGSGMTGDGYDTLWAGPAGAAWSTAVDLDLFLTVLLSGALVSRASLAAMRNASPVQAPAPWRQPGYGLGLMIDQGLRTVGHGGSGPGYDVAAFACAERGRSAVFLLRSPARAGAVELALRWLTAPDEQAGPPAQVR